ncbi:MAG: DUF4407 domain-containing protein [Stellaceae bacterium]
MNVFAWFAGVDPERLAPHRSSARYLVIAIGMTLALVSGPIVMAAMGSYAYAALPGWLGSVPRVLIAGSVGAVWMIVIWTIDRTLLITSDAVGGRRLMLVFGLAFRIAFATILASLFSNQLVEFLYAPMLDTTAAHLALSTREQDAARLAKLHGVPAAQHAVTALETEATNLAARYRTIPPSILSKFAVADRCWKQARWLADRVRRWPSDAGWRALAHKDALCRRLHAEAAAEKTAYLQEIAGQIRKNDGLLQAAEGRAESALAKFTADRRQLDASTEAGYSSVSSREIAFEALKQEHPEVRTKARLWWLTLLLLELLPLITKMMTRNNPASAEAEADLAEGAAHHRIRAMRVRALEERCASILSREDVHQSIDMVAAEYTVAMSHLDGFRQFVDRLARDIRLQRDFSRAHLDFATQADAAFVETIGKAFDSVIRRPASFGMAAE